MLETTRAAPRAPTAGRTQNGGASYTGTGIGTGTESYSKSHRLTLLHRCSTNVFAFCSTHTVYFGVH